MGSCYLHRSNKVVIIFWSQITLKTAAYSPQTWNLNHNGVCLGVEGMGWGGMSPWRVGTTLIWQEPKIYNDNIFVQVSTLGAFFDRYLSLPPSRVTDWLPNGNRVLLGVRRSLPPMSPQYIFIRQHASDEVMWVSNTQLPISHLFSMHRLDCIFFPTNYLVLRVGCSATSMSYSQCELIRNDKWSQNSNSYSLSLRLYCNYIRDALETAF